MSTRDFSPMRRKLTDLYVKSAKASVGGRHFVTDTEVPGLTFRVTSNGARSWLIRYRVKGQPRQLNFTPGPYPAVSLSDARQRAREIILAARRGIDLVEQERKELERQKQADAQIISVQKVAEDFVSRGLEAKSRAPSYITATRRMFDEYVIPEWGMRDIQSISRRDIVGLLDTIVDNGKPIVANRTLAAIRAMLNWAVKRGHLESSPASLIDRPAEERQRDRALADDEIKFLLFALNDGTDLYGLFLKMVLATGQRRNEVACMRWSDINKKERTWTLRGNMNKSGRIHVVPLCKLAIGVLAEVNQLRDSLKKEDEIERVDGIDDIYVFTTLGDRPISGHGKSRERISRAINDLRAKANAGPLEPWTVHDLRRTVATGLGKLGVSRFIIARVLNHADRTVTGIYDRYDYLAEKRSALDAWGNHLIKLTSIANRELRQKAGGRSFSASTTEGRALAHRLPRLH